jgi:hypothetical protein
LSGDAQNGFGIRTGAVMSNWPRNSGRNAWQHDASYLEAAGIK